MQPRPKRCGVAWISSALLTRAALFLVPARTTANNKEQLLLDLVSRAAASLNLGLEAIINALRAREELDPTGLGEGFALPHARIAGRDRFFAMFARLHKLDGAADRIPHFLRSGLRRLGAHFRQHKTLLIDQHAGADQRLKELIDQFGGCLTQTALVKKLLAVANNDVAVAR
jgi:Phosphoenolpyruvate-dependent sugar phosphotransferase system, EIIA 2